MKKFILAAALAGALIFGQTVPAEAEIVYTGYEKTGILIVNDKPR